MLIHSHRSATHFPFPNLHILAIVLSLLVFVNSVSDANIMRAQIPCNSDSAFIKVPLAKTKAGQLFLIRLYFYNMNTLPVAMTVYSNESDYQHRQVNRYMLYQNTGIDVDAIQIGKPIQILYYQTVPKQAQFVVGVHRLSYENVQYALNPDRNIQSYFGQSERYLINMCTMSIQFGIEILRLDTSISNVNAIYTAPLMGTQCVNGRFNQTSRVCECYDNYGMQLCDIKFTAITDTNKGVPNQMGSQQRQYYYYDSQASMGESEVLSIELRKSSSRMHYKYSENRRRQDFNVLYIIQPMSQVLRVPTIFNQFDPSSINNITLQSGYRLVICVWQPKWSTVSSYYLQLSKRLSLQQTVRILVKAVVIVTVGIVIVFVVCTCLSSQDASNQIHGVLARPTGIPYPISIYQTKFDIEKCFPTVNYNQLHALLSSIEHPNEPNTSHEQSACSICLDNFQTPDQQNIRMTYCCHIFHTKCLTLWTRKQISCPNCRTQFNQLYLKGIEEGACVDGAKLDPIDRYAKIWRYVKKIGYVQPNHIMFRNQCPTNQDIPINSHQKLPE